MVEAFDAIEERFGICEYLSEEPGFAAVLKARYSDFLVHETNRDGEIARLESLEAPKEPCDDKGVIIESEIEKKDSRKRKFSGEDMDEEPSQPEEIWNLAIKELTALVGEESAKNAVEVVRFWENNIEMKDEEETTRSKFAELPKIEEKERRKEIHQWIRNNFSKYAVGDSHGGRIRIWHKRFEKEMPTFGKFDKPGKARNERPKKQKWPDRPDFLQFVLYKENIDTGVATKDIAKRLKGRARLGYAGMKDKRGVTTQFCTLYRRRPEELFSFNKSQTSGGGGSTYGSVSIIRVGNFKYVDQEITLGMLKGNRFDICLRNVDVGQQALEPKLFIEQAAKAFQTNGFVNYFGMQRFGKAHDTHEVGIEILKGNFKGAIEIIMRVKTDELPRTNMAREKWQKRFQTLADDNTENRKKAEQECAEKVLKHMGRFMTCEVALLNSLKREPLNYRKAFNRIPKHTRSMFLHAVQSFVWNRVVSYRIKQLGKQVCKGDLVQLKETQNKDQPKIPGRALKMVKELSEEDVESGVYSLTDVVIPLVGPNIEYPTNEIDTEIEALLKSLEIEKNNFGDLDSKELNLSGDYRKIICKPYDIEYQIVEYDDPLQPLVQTDLMKINKVEVKSPEEGTAKKKLTALVVGFTLPPSSYATVALRELMKRPTSSEYQRQLQLEGDCEGKIGANVTINT